MHFLIIAATLCVKTVSLSTQLILVSILSMGNFGYYASALSAVGLFEWLKNCAAAIGAFLGGIEYIVTLIVIRRALYRLFKIFISHIMDGNLFLVFKLLVIYLRL